jgi:hypothetical protein
MENLSQLPLTTQSQILSPNIRQNVFVLSCFSEVLSVCHI